MPGVPFFKEPYLPGDTPLHRLDARIKLPLAIAFILTLALLPQTAWPVYPLFLAVLLSIALLSIGIRLMINRSFIAIPFLLAAVPLLFTQPGPALLQFSLGSLPVTISQAGLERLVAIGLKSWLSVQAAILLTATTSLPDLLLAFRVLHIPRLIVSTIGLMWRYLFLMVEEAARMLRARAARSGAADRSGEPTGGSVLWRARVTGGMAGSLLVRSFERSDRVYSAMLARGYDGETRSLPHAQIRRADWILFVTGVAVLLALLFLGWLFKGGSIAS